MIVITAPVKRIIKSIVSQRGMRFAGFVMAWALRNLHSPTRECETL